MNTAAATSLYTAYATASNARHEAERTYHGADDMLADGGWNEATNAYVAEKRQALRAAERAEQVAWTNYERVDPTGSILRSAQS